MKLVLLSTAKRKVGLPPWVCLSCRGIKQASTSSSPKQRFDSPSAASLELRKGGPARTRFAPSPTGYLHLGSLRTALFNYMVAKATGGQFLLRIEDTDQKRTVRDGEERAYQDLQWAGIQWDEGPIVGGPYGPYKQSERTAIHREHAEKLLQSGNAYRCFCTTERLRMLADHRSKLGLPPDYDRTCAHIPKEESDDRAAQGEAHVVRLLMPDQLPAFKDLIYGVVKQRKGPLKTILGGAKAIDGSYDDPILLKSDGFPTYHLANVVDDHLMKITHVIRGSEWMSSTPKHLAMYNAFGWSPPQFAHVGLLLDANRQKLSKRLEHTSIRDLREKSGVFPEALTNFVALLGWSHKETNDAMSLEDLVRNASLKFTKGDTVVDFGKLWYLQKRHAARYASLPTDPPPKPSHDLDLLALPPLLRVLSHNAIHQAGAYSFYRSLPYDAARSEYARSILWADAQNYVTADAFAKRNIYFWGPPNEEVLAESMPSFTLHRVPGLANQPSALAMLPFFENFREIGEDHWTTDELKSWIRSITEQAAFRSQIELKKRGQWHHQDVEEMTQKLWSKDWNRLIHLYIRWALMATLPGPNGAETMRILGREESLRRLRQAGGIVKRRVEEKTVKAEEDRRQDGDRDAAVAAMALAHALAREDVDGVGKSGNGEQVEKDLDAVNEYNAELERRAYYREPILDSERTGEWARMDEEWKKVEEHAKGNEAEHEDDG